MAKKKQAGGVRARSVTEVAENIKLQFKRDQERREHSKKYPMCEKLAELRDQKMGLLEFIDWLQSKNIWLCAQSPGSNFTTYHPIMKGNETLVHEHLEIDEKKLEEERRSMLEELQEKASGAH